MNLQKRQLDENFLDYFVRLHEKKDEYEIDKHRIAFLLNEEYGSDFDESKWRKDYSSYLKWKDYLSHKMLDKEVLKKYEEIKLEAEKVKIQKQDQQREYRKLIRNSARFEKIQEDIFNAVLMLEHKKPLEYKNEGGFSLVGKEGLLLLSDWHFGMEIDNYINRFNKKVFDKRIAKVTQQTITYGKRHGISVLHVANLGDLVAGLIHVSTRVQANSDVVEQIQYVAETLAEMLSTFANEFAHISFYNVAGNHSRILPNKSEVGIKENYEYLIAWYLDARLRNFSNITIHNEDDGFIHARIFNDDVIFTHGHYDKPDQSVKNIPQLLGIVPSYIFSAHIHHHYEREHGATTCIVNSSLVGTDDYAMQGRLTAKPAQKFFIFDEKDGIECTYQIKLANL